MPVHFLDKLTTATFYQPIVLMDVHVGSFDDASFIVKVGAEAYIEGPLQIAKRSLQMVAKNIQLPPASTSTLLCKVLCYTTEYHEVKISLFLDVPADVQNHYRELVQRLRLLFEKELTAALKRHTTDRGA